MCFRSWAAGATPSQMPLPAVAQEAEIVIKFATESSGEHLNIKTAEVLEREIEERTDGKVDFQIFPGAQLGDQKATMAGLQQGTHQMSLQASPMAAIEPAYGVFEAPFLFGNRDQVKRVLNGPLTDIIKERVAEKNIVVLAIGELGFRQISNNVRPIVVPEDLEGIKLRTPGNPFRVQTFEHFGANPTPMSFSEVYVALRQGVIDGQENPLGSIWGGKFHEVQNYISMSNHIFTPNSIVASKPIYDSWPADVQDAVREAAQVAADFTFEQGQKNDETLKSKMQAENPDLEFNEIDSEAFREKAQPLHSEIENKVGSEIWQMVTDQL